MAIKLNFPKSVYLLRGNHECRQMTNYFNFRQECNAKYDQDIYKRIMEVFDCLPISAIINGKFLSMHGGISPELKSVKDINKINRFSEPPKNGLFCDMLWSDPVNSESGQQDSVFEYNEQRGCSYTFGTDAVTKFLKRNKLLAVIRAHEVQLEGYKMYNWKGKDFP